MRTKVTLIFHVTGLHTIPVCSGASDPRHFSVLINVPMQAVAGFVFHRDSLPREQRFWGLVFAEGCEILRSENELNSENFPSVY